ncbi:MAG: hypothetical protein RLZZ480_341 [Candidatus Parcubacteria bacterium]
MDESSQFSKRISEYATHHDFTFVVMNEGVRQERTVQGTRVIVPGGKTLVSAFLKTLWEGQRQLKSESYDLITTQDVLYAGLVGYVLSRLFKKPLFVQVHGDYLGNERWFKSNVGRFNRLMNPVGEYVLKRAEQVRVVSGRLRADFITRYQLAPERVISIPIGTDLTVFRPSGEEARAPQIFFAQRLIPEKCPRLFAEVAASVMKELPTVTTTIAGDGFMKEELSSYFNQEGVGERVTFLGAVPHADLVRLYQTSKVYLHTADWEGWGMPMIEAMAAGCPVVTTDTGCAGEAVRHEETGLVTAINDKEALIRETKRLLTDEILWNRLSTNGIGEAHEWSFATLTNKNMEWYGQ